MNCELQDKIFLPGRLDFNTLAIELFRYQYAHNELYRDYANTIGITPIAIHNLAQIPFMPVGFFKNHQVMTGAFTPELVFESSGTTQTGNSRHLVKEASLYRNSFTKAFELFYGQVNDWCIIGLLPSYLERQNSSLVLMVDELIRAGNQEDSGFYLYDHDKLVEVIKKNESAGKKTMLIGVTFALLDLAEAFNYPLRHTVVMETGGMKGRRKEITREEVHGLLKTAWGLRTVHSEYGMTELLSQAYSSRNGIFRCPPWMKIMIREEDDPLSVKSFSDNHTQSGLVNVIDLANIYSCSFIATDDIGKLYPDGSFEITGRMDSSDLRGCSMMYS